MKGKLSLIFLLVFFSVFLFSQNARASDVGLLINEIYPNPTSDPADSEWIEIYDLNASDLDLTAYWLVKITNSGTEYKKQLSDVYCHKNDQYYVCDLGANWLANSGTTLILINNSLEIDKVTFGSQINDAPVADQGQSISRIPNGQDTGFDQDDFRVTAPTQAKENTLPSYPSGARINEIVPQPATGADDEFIEIYNFSDETIDLSGWQIDDDNGGSKPYLVPQNTLVAPEKYLVFGKNLTKISLNDSGDSARLIDPNGDIKSIVNYGKAKRGKSYSWFFDSWKWTNSITSGGENIFQEEIILPDEDLFVEEMPISQVRELPIEETVKVVGVVSVLPGKLSSQYFYLEDESGGIQIYSYHKSFPFLRLGDVLSIIGELAEYKNERRIKISSESDIQIISSRSPPEAKKIKIDDINEHLEGQYISVTGTVTKTSGSVFYIHGSGEIQVSIREGTGIKKPKMRVGDRVEVAGVLSQYDDYYRILPTRQDDVKIIESSGLAKSGTNVCLSLLITGVIFFLWTIYQKVKKKQLKLP